MYLSTSSQRRKDCKKIIGNYYKPLHECADAIVSRKVSEVGLDFTIVQVSLAGMAEYDNIRDAAKET